MYIRLRVFLTFSLFTLICQVPPAAAAGKIKLLASIKPLALIAQELAGDEVEVDTLLPVTASPHDYPLRMSDHRRLREADLLLWVGPELESFLARPLAGLDSNRIISAYDLAGIHFPEHEDQGQGEAAEHKHEGDPHLWLDPDNAVVIARALAQKLGQLQPSRAEQFNQRAQAFAQAVMQVDKQLRAQLEPLKDRGFAVYHEGYSHFVEHFGLKQLAYITFTPERRPGARHLLELRQALKAGAARCLFSEPYQKSDSLDALAQELGLRMGQLDPIGDAGLSSYGQLLSNLGQAFSACLADGGDN